MQRPRSSPTSVLSRESPSSKKCSPNATVITEQFVLARKRRGVFIVHDGRDWDSEASDDEIREMHKNVTQVIFLLNITQVGEEAPNSPR